jgi:hypothetical protein
MDKENTSVQIVKPMDVDNQSDLQLDVYEDKEYDIEEVKYINFMTKKRAIKPDIIRTLIYKVPEMPRPKQAFINPQQPSITPVTHHQQQQAAKRQPTSATRNRKSLNVTALDMTHYNTKSQVNYDRLDLSQFNPIGATSHANDHHVKASSQSSSGTTSTSRPLPDEIQPLKAIMEQKQMQQAKHAKANNYKHDQLYQLRQTNTSKRANYGTTQALNKPEIVIERDEAPSRHAISRVHVARRPKRTHKSANRPSVDRRYGKHARGLLIDDDDDDDEDEYDSRDNTIDFDYTDSDDEQIHRHKAKRQRTATRLNKNESFNEKFYNFLNKTRIDLNDTELVQSNVYGNTTDKANNALLFDRVFSNSFTTKFKAVKSRLTKDEIDKISNNFKLKTGIVLRECRVKLDKVACDVSIDAASVPETTVSKQEVDEAVMSAENPEMLSEPVVDDRPLATNIQQSTNDRLSSPRAESNTVVQKNEIDENTNKETEDNSSNSNDTIKPERTSPQQEMSDTSNKSDLNKTFDFTAEQARKRRRRSKNSRLSLDLARLDDTLLRTSTSSSESSTTRLTRSRLKQIEKSTV